MPSPISSLPGKSSEGNTHLVDNTCVACISRRRHKAALILHKLNSNINNNLRPMSTLNVHVFSYHFNISIAYHNCHEPLTRYVNLRIVHAPGMPVTFSPPLISKETLVIDPGMHRGTCGTHVPWCMPGSLTRGGGENAPGIPGAYAQPTILRIC